MQILRIRDTWGLTQLDSDSQRRIWTREPDLQGNETQTTFTAVTWWETENALRNDETFRKLREALTKVYFRLPNDDTTEGE